MAPVIKVNSQTMRSAADSSDAVLEHMATRASGGVPTVTAGSPFDGLGVAETTALEAVVTELAAVFAGQGPKVEAATIDGVLRFQSTDEQSQHLLREVGESATASGTVYTL